MKKIYLLLLIGVIISCSNDEDNVVEETQQIALTTPVLVTSSKVSQNGNYYGEATYNYSGSKLLTIVRGNGNQIDTFTYDGDLITKIETLNDGNLISKSEFEYDATDKLIHYYRIHYEAVYGQDDSVTIDYTHNANATISYIKNETLSIGSVVNSATTISGVIQTNNGMITSIQRGNATQGNQENYTYDTKNSPFKNITGFDKLIFEDNNLLFYPAFNNIIGKQYTSGSYIEQTNYSYEYNADNYPTKQIRDQLNSYVLEVITEYTYNQ